MSRITLTVAMEAMHFFFFFHIKIEFIFAGKTFLHLNLRNLVKQSSNNIF